ncbi:hypothetical protein GCM10020367_20620 [Streptomyces sannanensis]|uniref:Uncharacterized protein n=1 Tax=Streptomyces sannanensis TaxID=285536 RepID=A0ABP6S997_9ACTN
MLQHDEIQRAEQAVHHIGRRNLPAAARRITNLMNGRDCQGQYEVAVAITETSASLMRLARPCEHSFFTVHPALALDTSHNGRSRLWAARFHAAITNDDHETAFALWHTIAHGDRSTVSKAIGCLAWVSSQYVAGTAPTAQPHPYL